MTFNKLMGVPEGYRPPAQPAPAARPNDMPMIIIVLGIAGWLAVACAAWTTLLSMVQMSGAGVALGLSWLGAAVMLFAIASVIRKLYQIEFHLRGRA
jgi:hypothetical protein